MKSSMSMDRALFSLKSASCKTLSIFLLMLKSAGTSCYNGRQDFRLTLAKKCHRFEFVPRGSTQEDQSRSLTTLCIEQWIL